MLNRIANPGVALVLRFPLHGLLSRSVMLITVTGRRTGRRITLPVQYVRQGDDLLIRSSTDRRWWRNVAGGAQVTVRIGGELLGHAALLPIDPAEPERVSVRVSALRPLGDRSPPRAAAA